MKIFRAEYKVNENHEKLESILDGELSRETEINGNIHYTDGESNLATSKFIYFKSKQKLVEKLDVDYNYTIGCILVLSMTVFTHTTDIFIGILRDTILVTTGLYSLLLFLMPTILSNKKYSFLDSSHNASKDLGVPYLYRSKLRISLLCYFILLISAFNLWAWIFPDPNILSYIITISAGIAILISMRKDPHDRITARFLFLFAVAMIPVATVIGNILVYTQFSAYRQQEMTILNPLIEVYSLQTQQLILELIYFNPIIIILILNILAFLFGIMVFPLFWSRITKQEPDYIVTNEVAHDRVVRGSMSLLAATYIISGLSIPILVEFEFVKIGIDSSINLFWLYSPLIVFGLFHSMIKLRQYLKQRSRLSTIETKGSEDVLPDAEVKVVLSDKIESPARSVDILGREPIVVINKSLAQNLKVNELRAIYNHELYHLQKEDYNRQLLSNLPIIGPLLFFILVSPKKVFQEEYRADKYAIKKINQQAVVRVLVKANRSESVVDPHKIGKYDSWSVASFWMLLTSIPIVSLYRPTRTQRIRNISSNEG